MLAWRGAIKGVSQGITIPVSESAYKAVGQDYVSPQIGYAIAVVAIAAVVWFALRARRVRQRQGLLASGALTTLITIILPAVLIVVFIQAMNSYAGIPIPVIIFLAVAASGAFLTQNTTFGRYLYAIGGNPEAARLSGINLRVHTLAVFVLMGLLAGVASIICTQRVSVAHRLMRACCLSSMPSPHV
ncbi:MAG: hypothetical protein WKF84_11250 [Pyrinomonadaceae bacterium]